MRTFTLIALSSLLFSTSASAEDARQRELIGLWRSATNCQISLAADVDTWVKAMINSSDGAVSGEAVDLADKEFGEQTGKKQVVTFCWTTRDRLKAAGLL